MPKITALIHAHADAARLGRLLDSLRPGDEVLVISHNADEATEKIARAHGAEVRRAVAGVAPGAYALDARHDWIFCLRSDEALSEGLEAALFQWKEEAPGERSAFRVAVRAETAGGWTTCPPETRLVNRTRLHWTMELPPNDPTAPLLGGDLLRFREP